MNRYEYPDDGKLHVRYSELSRCTPGQIDRVVFERLNQVDGFKNEDMADGIERHEMWEAESRRTGHTPAVFKKERSFSVPVSHIEHSLASEIFPGVVLHSTIDAVAASQQLIVDYKTITGNPMAYGASKQLKLYAWQLAVHDIRITKGAFLCEIWEKDEAGARTKIKGYVIIWQDITLLDMDAARKWCLPRVALLKAALAEAA